ncbi:MAG: ATP-binding protein [Cyanobacteriota bacterium]|nr:ATP-binding protein [Cyanobacteriota bacterium]
MKSIIKKLLAPRQIEYLVIDKDWIVLEISVGLKRLADNPEEAILGKDVRKSFPELIGLENIFTEVLEERQENFQLKGIARSRSQNSPLYIDLYLIAEKDEKATENNLMLLVEDATEKMVTQQALIQAANESNLLLSALAASKDYIDKILTSMTDVLLVTNKNGSIKTVNPAAENLFGYKEEELIDRSISKVIPEEHLLHQVREQKSLDKAQKPEDLEVICQAKNDQEVILEFSCSPIQSDVKGLIDFVYIGRDITIRKRQEEELNLALQKEKELTELRNRFFSMVAHEFGNPLNAILFSCQLLQEYKEDITEQEKDQYVAYIRESAKQTIELLNDVRFIGKAESSGLAYKPEAIDLISFCSHLVEGMKITTSGKHEIKLNITNNSAAAIGEENPPVEPNNLHLIDKKLLRHILTNLLSNAIKYSPKGGRVHFDLIVEEEEATFKIKDEGIGIPPANLEKLFQSFYRAQNVGEIPGSGLGLAIVKQCVDLQGGTIEVTSELGSGTAFIVTIPLKQQEL